MGQTNRRFAMRLPTISVIDLTSQLGLYALGQLGVEKPLGYGHWRQVPLGGVDLAPRFDWQRPEHVRDLVRPSPQSDAVVVLIGPGAVNLLHAALTLLTRAAPRRLWLYLMPNALMEDLALREPRALQLLPAAQVYRLPDSSPQTFWLVLLEQLNQFGFRDLQYSGVEGPLQQEQNHTMTSNLRESMDAAMTINGALAVALVDYRSGMCLAQAGGGFNLDLAAAGNTEVVRAKLKTIESLGLRKGIEDILITLADQYHLIRLVPNAQGLFLYLVLDKEKGNLALARFKLTDIERSLRV